jgi:hypothetical protein
MRRRAHRPFGPARVESGMYAHALRRRHEESVDLVPSARANGSSDARAVRRAVRAARRMPLARGCRRADSASHGRRTVRLKGFDMHKTSSWLAAVAAGCIAVAAVPAQAKGCIKGAVVGGVGGHLAGHHAVAGAVVGCAVGHHLAAKRDRAAAQAAAASQAPAGAPRQ